MNIEEITVQANTALNFRHLAAFTTCTIITQLSMVVDINMAPCKNQVN